MNSDNTKIVGKIDIVAHSMGFAYSLGMVSYLRDKMEPDQNGHRFGRFYILAPENACSAPAFPVSDFEEIYQYGTVEYGQQNPHKAFENDGVAPQCTVTGLSALTQSNYARVRFPTNSKFLNFVDAHLVANYLWIFNIVVNTGKIKSRV